MPFGGNLIRMRHTEDLIVSEQRPYDRCAYRLFWAVLIIADPVRDNNRWVPSLVSQTNLARTCNKHVKAFHTLSHLLHQQVTTAL